MTYWVEYSFQKGIRENLMTDSAVNARRIALGICKNAYKTDYRSAATLYTSSKSKPIGKIYFAGGYVGRWMWMPIDKSGVQRFPYYALSDGRIVKMKEY